MDFINYAVFLKVWKKKGNRAADKREGEAEEKCSYFKLR